MFITATVLLKTNSSVKVIFPNASLKKRDEEMNNKLLALFEGNKEKYSKRWSF